MKNIVLIGMPGCGKTTIGQIVAAKSGKVFVDSDTVIAEATGMSIPEIFEKEGEEGFRLRETKALKEICVPLAIETNGLVIATGGGCVTREENLPTLKQNGVIVFIERDISLLERQGRPLSAGDLSEMYRQRLPLYRRFADHTVQNDQTAEITAENILRIL